MRKILSVLSVFLLLSLIFFSCKKETKIVYEHAVVDSARISITNASPALSNLIFYLDNQKMSLPDSPLAYGITTFATYVNNNNENNPIIKQLPYFSIAAGYRELGFSSYSPYAAFLTNGYFKPGASYSIFITDTITHGQAQCVVLLDNVGVADTTHGQFRFINLSPDSPPLDLYAFPDAGQNGFLVSTNTAYLPNNSQAQVSAQSFSLIPAGPYYFVATLTGTHNIVLEGGLIIPPQNVVTIYAKGFIGGTGNNAIDVGVILYKP